MFEIIINGKKCLYTTSFKDTKELDVNEIPTHSGPILSPKQNVSATVSVERATKFDYVEEQEVMNILERMETEPATIVAVNKQPKGVLRKTFINCLLSKDESEVKDTEETSFSFEFKAEKRIQEWSRT